MGPQLGVAYMLSMIHAYNHILQITWDILIESETGNVGESWCGLETVPMVMFFMNCKFELHARVSVKININAIAYLRI